MHTRMSVSVKPAIIKQIMIKSKDDSENIFEESLSKFVSTKGVMDALASFIIKFLQTVEVTNTHVKQMGRKWEVVITRKIGIYLLMS